MSGAVPPLGGAGRGLEKVLLEKLLTAALPEEGEDEEAGMGPQVASMPETFADAIVAAGGVGLAASLGAGTGAR
ncbi:MAG TPA: hypothetical protein VMT37_08020 [Solirubrobacterales bacterium]|nr:hypothetical protein [Solirubrobacterales bacterium]